MGLTGLNVTKNVFEQIGVLALSRHKLLCSILPIQTSVVQFEGARLRPHIMPLSENAQNRHNNGDVFILFSSQGPVRSEPCFTNSRHRRKTYNINQSEAFSL